MSTALMASEGIVRAVLSAVITAVVGALATLFVERVWKRHTSKQVKKEEGSP